ALEALESCGCPSSKSTIPPMRTAARLSSNGTPDRPAAAIRRPQLGSPPCTAVLTRRELAIVRAAFSACAHSRAPFTRTATSLVVVLFAQHACGFVDAFRHFSQVEIDADDSGGGHQDFFGPAIEQPRRDLGGGFRDVEPGVARTGVGAAAVADDGTRVTLRTI